MRRLALLGLVALAACGGEETPQTTDDEAFVPPAPPTLEPLDVDSLGLDEDDLAMDSLALADSASAEAEPLPAAPDFAPFLSEFKRALQTGAAERYAAPGLDDADLAFLVDDPAFRQRFLAAPPDRYRREGTRREVYVVVGYDLEGNVVPEDEAETESGLGLVFDVVDGAYRLVRVSAAG
ncbi:MAG TPA: hypothetical protein EYQ24_05960 [Bacteroidetes bacterium]|nr:hypothetical protein [Bacteroidota bacterium]